MTALTLGTCAGTATDPARAAGTTERVSVATGGAQADFQSLAPAISDDGRFVAFASGATNLVPGDTNTETDIFVRDRRTGRTERVSVGAGGAQAERRSGSPAISPGGRFVAFSSFAANLVPGDTNGRTDVFVHDRQTGRTERVSVGPGGVQANDTSLLATISANGRIVAFVSRATNLVASPDDNNDFDVFVRDRFTGRTERISVGDDGLEGDTNFPQAAISADGRFVAFSSSTTNGLPGDTNGSDDIFVRDRQAGRTERVSVSTAGVQGNAAHFSPAISADGRFVAFSSIATNLVPGDTNGVEDIFVRDRHAGTTERVSVGPGGAQAARRSGVPALSAGGRFVAFTSKAGNLVPGDTNGQTDIFVHDRETDRTELVSVGRDGAPANGASAYSLAIAAGGRFVAFESFASNLVPGDTNRSTDVFVRAR